MMPEKPVLDHKAQRTPWSRTSRASKTDATGERNHGCCDRRTDACSSERRPRQPLIAAPKALLSAAKRSARYGAATTF
jgi:hypothetical protein